MLIDGKPNPTESSKKERITKQCSLCLLFFREGDGKAVPSPFLTFLNYVTATELINYNSRQDEVNTLMWNDLCLFDVNVLTRAIDCWASCTSALDCKF